MNLLKFFQNQTIILLNKMEEKDIINSAKILFDLKLNAQSIEKLKNNLSPKNINDAYLIQEKLKINYLTLKENFCIGKISFTYSE